MADIFIPEDVADGFRKIMNLTSEKTKEIAAYISTITFSSNYSKVLSQFDDFLSKNLDIKQAKKLIEAILSFVDIRADEDFKNTSEKLAEAYKELYSPEISTEELNSLKDNLFTILTNSDNLKISLKALRLASENTNIYAASKIISDVRIIFNDDLDSKDRKAVLIHNLHISFRSDKISKDFFVTLDIDDLKKLKDSIERAIKKEEIIKEEYNQFHII